ncbi:MAG: terpene cyclase/mutase family protein [Planctomycetes bacterium]|nr:terpene cyclase/mutase family protein [Planctomycetota bacterium]
MKGVLAILAALLLAPLPGSSADEGAFSVSWKAPGDSIVHVRATPPSDHPDPKPQSRDLRVNGFQLLPKGPDGGSVQSIEGIPDPLVLAMPPDGTKLGGRWRHAMAADNIPGFPEMEVRGGFRLKEPAKDADPNVLLVEGKFEVVAVRRPDPKPTGYRLRAGQISTTSRIDVQKGEVSSGEAAYEVTFNTDGGEVKFAGKWVYSLVEVWSLPDSEFQAAVDGAVEKGVAWLKGQQKDDGSFGDPGYTALALYALLKSDVHRDDPVIQKGFDFLKDKPFERTYNVSCLVLALEARWEPPRDVPEPPGHPKVRMPADQLDWTKRAVDWLLEKRTSEGVWHYPSQGASYDHSNTQYAVLALKSATRCGIEVPLDVWTKTIDHFAGAQDPDGPAVGLDRTLDAPGGDARYDGPREYVREARARGWAYTKGGSSYGSMTSAGVGCQVLALSGLIDAGRLDRANRAKAEVSIRDGLAWLGRHYSVLDNPKYGQSWYYYYLYGLERALILSRTRTLSGRDWYRDGARVLVKLQGGDGSWPVQAGTTGTVDNAAFALLFLKRATRPVAITSGE